MTERVHLDNVSKGFGGMQAVRDATFSLESGKILVLLGPSGCGKTTTLRLIAGLERPDAGQIALGDTVVAGDRAWIPPESRRIGFVFQDYALFPHLSVEKNITFGLKGYRGDKAGRVDEMLKLVGLEGTGDRMPYELSGGQQQRVALARALAPEPGVLLLDEPFSNLDAALRAQVRGEVRAILRQTGVTSVFVTHDQEEALSLADHVAVMFDGMIHQIDTPQAVYTSPATRDVAAFVGEANFIPGQADGSTASSMFGELPLSQHARGEVDLLLRPEALTLGSPENGGPHGVVESVEFFGHDQRLHLRLDDDTPLICRLDAWQTYRPGERVSVGVQREVQPFSSG